MQTVSINQFNRVRRIANQYRRIAKKRGRLARYNRRRYDRAILFVVSLTLVELAIFIYYAFYV